MDTMDTTFCHCSSRCRKNNKQDLNCFCCLGERFWFSEIKDSFWSPGEDPITEKKTEDGYVGLKNLGATCYVNTFLQLWFNNLSFRSAIFNWTLPIGACYNQIIIDDDDNGRKHIELLFEGDSTTVICGQLQYLFALLLYSTRRYIDPSSFIKSIGIQTDQQQDAQEFSKLFTTLLQDKFAKQDNFIIHKQFGGSYFYQTTCSQCRNITRTNSEFFELDLNIKGHLKLKKCLQEFFTEEILEGNNMYFCSFCQCKRIAQRKIVLERLPPVLNLQLLRFVFDRKTGNKKKLNCVIQFPDVLDMNEYMGNSQHTEDAVYTLTAVLIHCGMTAHSGHYIAHILDEQKGVWCRFNDEGVDEIKGKTLQLGKEDDPEIPIVAPTDINGKKRQKKELGHTSKNAYMLVYTRKKSDMQQVSDVPDWLKEVVACDNSLFESWLDTKTKEKSEAVESGKVTAETIKSIYSTLKADSQGICEYISTDWLRIWLDHNQLNTPPVNNELLLCKHSKVDPNKSALMKKISVSAADIFYSMYGGSPRLSMNELCQICEKEKTEKETFMNRLTDDLKVITKAQKNKSVITTGYWVGNQSLRRFKNLAIKESSNEIENGTDGFQFNSDIVCVHDRLCLSHSSRKLVTEEVWNICKRYFPNVPTFSENDFPCFHCQKDLDNIKEENEALKEIVNLQKEQLSFLNKNHTNRCKEFIQNGNTIKLYVVLEDFVQEWKKKIRSGKLLEGEIDNVEFFCPHELPLYSAEEIIDEATKNEPTIIMINEQEYTALKSFYPIKNEISLSSINNSFTIEPLFCPNCRLERLSLEAMDSKLYQNAPIFVFKTDKDNKEMLKEKYKAVIESDDDRESPAKKLKLSIKDNEQRRSSRWRTKRGEYMLKVNSDQTLRELKIQLLSTFSILPMDQNISFESGDQLVGDETTLLDLGVKPGDHLVLTVDDPVRDADVQDVMIESSGSQRAIEEGFKGTQLLNG